MGTSSPGGGSSGRHSCDTGLNLLKVTINPWPLNGTGFYSEEASIRGNTVLLFASSSCHRYFGPGDQNPQGYWSPGPTSPRKRAGYNGPGWGLWSGRMGDQFRRAITGPTTVTGPPEP